MLHASEKLDISVAKLEPQCFGKQHAFEIYEVYQKKGNMLHKGLVNVLGYVHKMFLQSQL